LVVYYIRKGKIVAAIDAFQGKTRGPVNVRNMYKLKTAQSSISFLSSTLISF
jgi:hypothetical protein